MKRAVFKQKLDFEDAFPGGEKSREIKWRENLKQVTYFTEICNYHRNVTKNENEALICRDSGLDR